MDPVQALNRANELKADKLASTFEAKGILLSYHPTAAQAARAVSEKIAPGSKVAFGGSMTLREAGILDILRERGDTTLLDRDAPGLTPEQTLALARDSFNANFYLTSANAITMDGKIVNVDGRGNRVAAIAFGPSKVFVVSGINKLVGNLDAAIERIKNFASPANCLRLNIATPCARLGHCPGKGVPRHGCICCTTTITETQREVGRIEIFLVGENLGF